MNFNIFNHFYTVYSYTHFGQKEIVNFDPFDTTLSLLSFTFVGGNDTIH